MSTTPGPSPTRPDAGRPGDKARRSPAPDETAKAIIAQLQEDGRRSYASIAQAVGLSEAAVRQRVQRMTEAGALQIVAVTDPLQLGFTRQAMLAVRAHGDPVEVADRLAELPEVTYCVVTAGPQDLLAEVVCGDDAELLEILRTIRAVEGVASTRTSTYLSLRKQTYDWGTR